MANFLALNANGDIAEVSGKASSAGAADAGKIPQLDGTGKLDITLLPNNIGADAIGIVASEALAAGAWVNIYNNSGTANVRNAIASGTGFMAHGYVASAVSSGQTATVYFDDTNSQVSGLTPGVMQFLSDTTAGASTATAPTASGKIVQRLGVAASATSVHANIDTRPIIRT